MGLFGKRKKHDPKPAGEAGDYFSTQAFEQHRDWVNSIIMALPHQEAPNGWKRWGSLAVGGLEYMGFDEASRYMLIISSSGRGVYDLSAGEIVARDKSPGRQWLDEGRLRCSGIGPIDGEIVPIVGNGGGGLRSSTPDGDSLYLAAPLFPCYDVVFQPNYQHCLVEGRDRDCAVIYRGFVNYCGFSRDGGTMVVVDEDIHIWRKLS